MAKLRDKFRRQTNRRARRFSTSRRKFSPEEKCVGGGCWFGGQIGGVEKVSTSGQPDTRSRHNASSIFGSHARLIEDKARCCVSTREHRRWRLHARATTELAKASLSHPTHTEGSRSVRCPPVPNRAAFSSARSLQIRFPRLVSSFSISGNMPRCPGPILETARSPTIDRCSSIDPSLRNHFFSFRDDVSIVNIVNILATAKFIEI